MAVLSRDRATGRREPPRRGRGRYWSSVRRFAASALVVFGVAFASGSSLAERPNLLLIVAEDMSPRIGAFGDPVAVTPHLDRLAAEGVRFPNTFTTAGVCAPSRAALMTGRYQTSIGAHAMRTSGYGSGQPDVKPQGYEAVPPSDVKAFPELLRARGYTTLNSVKTDYQFGEPFTLWDENGFFVSWTDYTAGHPFFAMENLMVTHESGLFPKRLPRDAAEGLLRLLHLPNEWRYEAVVDPADVVVPAYYPDTEIVRATLARQYGNIALLDAKVGQILEELDEKGLADSTIVIFTTDHGDGLPRAKREVYDSGIRVPLIIRWPSRWRPEGLEPGDLDERMVSFIDLAPQILAFAGVSRPPFMQGRAFVGPHAGEPRSLVFAARDRMDEVEDRVRAVRDARFKYIRNYRPEDAGAQRLAFRDHLDLMEELWELEAAGRLEGAQALWFASPRPEEELYDVTQDPQEVQNLAALPAYAADVERMRAELDAWLTDQEDQGAVPEARLVERFWPGGIQPVTAAPVVTLESSPEGGSRVRVHCETAGASIGYRVDGTGNRSDWNLYTGPFEVGPGEEVEAKAIRYGYRESETALFEVP